jgi:acid phosphatase type 7
MIISFFVTQINKILRINFKIGNNRKALPIGAGHACQGWATVATVGLFLLTLTANAQKLIRNPYLQQPTESSIVIRWRTDLPTNSRISYYPASDSTKITTIADSLVYNNHSIKITNLQPDTKYFYRVGNLKTEFIKGANNYFITAPKADSKRPIRLWAMGDFGDGTNEKYINNQRNVMNQYLKNRKGHTDLWLWLGDNAYCCGYDEEFQKFVFDVYGNPIFGNTPFMPAAGNHEYYAINLSDNPKKTRKIPFFDMISPPFNGEAGGTPSGTKAYYSYNYGNTHFVVLDSYGMDDEKYILADKDSPQLKWLERDLAANKSLWTVVYYHHPVYTKGSHDSDAEPDLVALRQVLVPVFDKYKVDIVMSGHSHTYERSFLIKGHTGHWMSFDSKFIVQNTNAEYSKFSRPIINKDEGTVYLTVGSAGRLDWNGDPQRHPTSAYSNYEIGGSLSLTIDQNRLSGEWVCSDGVIRDKFTIFKNVNKTSKQTVEFGSKVKLNASWRGNYRWSNGVINQDNIEFIPRKDTVVTVSDSLNYLMDRFEISVLPQPKTIAKIAENGVICSKKELKLNFETQNTDFNKWNYSLELSDKNGDFKTPIVLAKGRENNFTFVLPDTLVESDKYRLRVHSDADFFDEVPTNSFRINHLSEARFLNESQIPFEPETTLKVQFKGSFPITYRINNFAEQKTDKLIEEIKVTNSESVVYSIQKLENICGIGKIDDKKVAILAPLSIDENSQNITIYPNPASNVLFIENHSEKSLKTTISIFDSNGKKVFGKSTVFDSKEEISLENLSNGTYFVEIRNRKGKWTRRMVKM